MADHDPSPHSLTYRLHWPDSLRGLALFAILIANVPYAGPEHTTLNRDWFIGSPLTDDRLNFLFHLLIDKKFIGIFSLLFGFGFFVQMKNAQERGFSFQSYFSKRMLLLFVLGCLHAYLLWFGDIIRYYAIGGVILLLIYHWSPRKILTLSMITTLFTGVVYIVYGIFDLQQYSYDPAITYEHGETTSYLRYIVINFTIDPIINFIQDSPITLFFTTGCMMLGFALAKMGFFHTPEKFNRFLIYMLFLGPIIGLPCSYLFWKLLTGELELSLALVWLPLVIVVGFVLQSLFYVIRFIKAYHSSWRSILSVFGNVGKMSLSAYVLQSVLYAVIFFHWTGMFQLYGKLTLAETYLITCAMFTVEIAICIVWLRLYKQGPLEYVWKKMALLLTSGQHP